MLSGPSGSIISNGFGFEYPITADREPASEVLIHDARGSIGFSFGLFEEISTLCALPVAVFNVQAVGSPRKRTLNTPRY